MALVGFGMTLQLKGLAASVTDYDRFMQDFVVFFCVGIRAFRAYVGCSLVCCRYHRVFRP